MDKKFYIQPILSDELRESILRATSITNEYHEILNRAYAPMLEKLVEPLNQLRESMISTIDTSAFSSVLSSVMDLNVRPILETCNMSSAFTNMSKQLSESLTMSIPRISEEYVEILSKYEELFSQIDSFSESEIETMLDGTDYTIDEIYEDIELFKQEIIETPIIGDVSDELLPEDRMNEFLKNHPALAHILYVMNIILLVLSGVQTLDDIVIPGIQNVIVTMQGKEDIFFIKVDSAKLYTEPSSHSAVIMNILYGEQVDLVESQKLWDKVTYINHEGEEIEGWIAKRNLMTYQDYQFNSDDLYDLD